VPVLALAVIPLGVFVASTRSTKRVAWRVGLTYLLLLLFISLALPQATGVARWESDVLDHHFRPSHYAEFVLVGVFLGRSLFALGMGVALAVTARQRPWALPAVACILPVAAEAATLLEWLPSWYGSLFVSIVTYPQVPEWVGPPEQAVVVGISYFGPPILAGAVTAIAARALVDRDARTKVHASAG
jgi:hypothetical protein